MLPICNYNIRDALKQVTRIVTNKRWFEKPESLRTTFINPSDYRYGESSLLRCIALHNFTIYTGEDSPLKNVFRNTIDSDTDLLVLYIIRFLQIVEHGHNEYRLASKKQIVAMFDDVFGLGEKIGRLTDDAIKYMLDCELVVTDETADGIEHYALMPRGDCLVKMLQDSAVLIEICRDDVFLSFSRNELIAPTSRLTDSTLWRALGEMFQQICKAETTLLAKCKENGTTDLYKNVFSSGLLSTIIYTGIRHTFGVYFSGDNGAPPEIKALVNSLHDLVEHNQKLLED